MAVPIAWQPYFVSDLPDTAQSVFPIQSDHVAMAHRSQRLQEFLAAIREAIAVRAGTNTPAAVAMRRVNASLDVPAPAGNRPEPWTFPACTHLDAAIMGAMRGPADIARVAGAIKILAPELCWRLKPSEDALFANGHANADILGSSPEALEQREDIRIGLSLMAPGITYPDHSHPPEEVYLTLSRGFWRNDAEAWREPGTGGIFYNPRGITHAMRSSFEPLLAIWCLPID